MKGPQNFYFWLRSCTCAEHFIYPRPNCSIEELLEFSVKTESIKFCGCCDQNKSHEVYTRIEHPPDILVLVLSRFGSDVIGTKNRDGVLVNDVLRIANNSFSLLGSIHHHGNTIRSGHYTCNISYPDSAYTCNDNNIISLSNINLLSDSAYLVFYCRD